MADCCRKAGISQATYFNWKKKCDGLLPTEMKRLKQLGDENGRLGKLVADLSLDKEMLQDVIRRNCKSWSQTRAGGAALSGIGRVDPPGPWKAHGKCLYRGLQCARGGITSPPT